MSFLKKTVLGAMLATAALAARAQVQVPPQGPQGFRLGVNLSPNIGGLHGTNIKSNGSRLGVTAGVITEFNFAPRFALSSGLNIMHIGANTTEVDVNPYDFNSPDKQDVYNLRYGITYLELPVIAKLKTEKLGPLAWYGALGLSNGFMLSARQTAWDAQNKLLAENVNVNVRTVGYRAGLVIGGGAEYDIWRRTTLTAGLSYNMGITDVLGQGGRSGKNSFLALNLGILF